jgi:hypothetical protein
MRCPNSNLESEIMLTHCAGVVRCICQHLHCRRLFLNNKARKAARGQPKSGGKPGGGKRTLLPAPVDLHSVYGDSRQRRVHIEPGVNSHDYTLRL